MSIYRGGAGLLFATDADKEVLRILTYNVSIVTADVFARQIIADAPRPGVELIADLWRFLNRCASPDPIDLFRTTGQIDDVSSLAAQARLFKLVGSRVEMRKRYTEEILPRTLQPFAISLTCDHKRDVVIESDNRTMELVSEWHSDNKPKDRSALQFFELVGHLGGSVQHALFVDGEIKRALARGQQGQMTTDAGDLANFRDRQGFLRWLSKNPLPAVG